MHYWIERKMILLPLSLLVGLAVWLLLAMACQRRPARQAEAAARAPADCPKKNKRSQAAATFPAGAGQTPAIPPGTCRLLGKVVAILPQRDQDRQTPCGQAPCRARVQVQRILGYGAAFGAPLAEGQEIKVYFTFTLEPSGKYFPELSQPLPGLQPGSLFEADVPAPRQPKDQGERWYQVGVYKVR